MAIIYDYRVQFIFAFFIFMLILLMFPSRAETALNSPEMIIARDYKVLQHNVRITHSYKNPYKNIIMNKLNTLSALKENDVVIFFDSLVKDCGINVLSFAPEPIFGQKDNIIENEGSLMESFQARIYPLVEISYSINERIALELTGHFTSQATRISPLSGNENNLFGYSLMVGPSFHICSPGKTTHIYTQIGLGYKFIDTGGYSLPGYCPSALGTGLCFGLKTKSANIKLGVNHFRSFTDTTSYQYNYDTESDPSLVFFFITYNFDS